MKEFLDCVLIVALLIFLVYVAQVYLYATIALILLFGVINLLSKRQKEPDPSANESSNENYE